MSESEREMEVREGPQSWMREPWPWLLMAGPAAVVVAGAVTVWLAVSTSDGLVAEDYYKRGLTINRVLDREQAAAKLGVRVAVEHADGRLLAHLSLDGESPDALFAQLAHATRAGNDQRLRLVPRSGVYETDLGDLPRGRWRIVIEDPRQIWRVSGEWTPGAGRMVLGEARAAGREE